MTTDLSTATLEELWDEICLRYESAVIVVENPDKIGKTTSITKSFSHGRNSACIGLLVTAVAEATRDFISTIGNVE